MEQSMLVYVNVYIVGRIWELAQALKNDEVSFKQRVEELLAMYKYFNTLK